MQIREAYISATSPLPSAINPAAGLLMLMLCHVSAFRSARCDGRRRANLSRGNSVVQQTVFDMINLT
jgi:hypothetical protein